MALSAGPIISGAGVAIDSTRAYVVESRLGEALDAAELAASRVALEERMEDDAGAFFAANYPDGFLGTQIRAANIDIAIDSDNAFITVTAATEMPASFMRLFGIETVQAPARSVIQRLVQGAEIALVMDNTGSMKGSKIDAMKAAAADLVNIVFGAEESYDHLWFSLVSYTSTVNVGSARTNWLTGYDPAFNSAAFGPTSWKECVQARWQTNRDETDDPPAIQRFNSFLYPSTFNDPDPNAVGNEWRSNAVDERQAVENDGYGPNLGCGPAFTPLTNQKSQVLSAIDEMANWHRGGTTSNLGLVWGWRTLSPDWRGLWDVSDRPVAYDNDLITKMAIVLTDGENQFLRLRWRGNLQFDARQLQIGLHGLWACGGFHPRRQRSGRLLPRPEQREAAQRLPLDWA